MHFDYVKWTLYWTSVELSEVLNLPALLPGNWSFRVFI